MKSRKTDNEPPRRERRIFTDEFERHAVRRQLLSHYRSYHSLPSWIVGRSYEATGGACEQ
jgi:hypothetical protein